MAEYLRVIPQGQRQEDGLANEYILVYEGINIADIYYYSKLKLSRRDVTSTFKVTSVVDEFVMEDADGQEIAEVICGETDDEEEKEDVEGILESVIFKRFEDREQLLQKVDLEESKETLSRELLSYEPFIEYLNPGWMAAHSGAAPLPEEDFEDDFDEED